MAREFCRSPAKASSLQGVCADFVRLGRHDGDVPSEAERVRKATTDARRAESGSGQCFTGQALDKDFDRRSWRIWRARLSTRSTRRVCQPWNGLGVAPRVAGATILRLRSTPSASIWTARASSAALSKSAPLSDPASSSRFRIGGAGGHPGGSAGSGRPFRRQAAAIKIKIVGRGTRGSLAHERAGRDSSLLGGLDTRHPTRYS